MNYNVGQRLRVDGEMYEITGKIVYTALWVDYCLRSLATGREKWLSCDNSYQEYSISEKAYTQVSFNGYHVVDEGVQEVLSAAGRVDVVKGDKATFVEYEDVTEEKIISIERWDDEEEISVGYYLDLDEIVLIQGNGQNLNSSNYNSNTRGSRRSGAGKSVSVFLFLGIFAAAMAVSLGSANNKNKISTYLSKTATYQYETSITGVDKEHADVYVTQYSIDQAARDIIDGIEGNTQDIQQNTEDGDDSVAILTSSEYCIIYTSEDGETLVQVSTREYAYRSDRDLYRGNRYSNRYYRRYYYSRGYASDITTYDDYSSPYSSYSDDTLSTSYDNTYNTYSSSVRQASVSSRTSSGGGLSSGK